MKKAKSYKEAVEKEKVSIKKEVDKVQDEKVKKILNRILILIK